MKQEAEPRYEIKLLCAEISAPSVLAELRMATAGLRQLFPARLVQSVYLDTHDGRAVAENLAGISDREKIRFRWYGSATRGVRGQLECKRRTNMLGDKEVEKLPSSIDVDGTDRIAFVRTLRAWCSPRWRERIEGNLEPAQWIRYRREYLQTADGVVRVTIDRGLQAFDLRDAWRLSDRHPTALPRVMIVECKAPVSRRDRIEALLQEMPLVVDKCSKFVMASAPAHAPIVSVL